MRNRLIYYHYESKGNWKRFYQKIIRDLPLFAALKKQSFQIPGKYIRLQDQMLQADKSMMFL